MEIDDAHAMIDGEDGDNRLGNRVIKLTFGTTFRVTIEADGEVGEYGFLCGYIESCVKDAMEQYLSGVLAKGKPIDDELDSVMVQRGTLSYHEDKLIVVPREDDE